MNINTVANIDCLKYMENIESGSVDLVITDPPYLMDYQSSRRKNKFDKIANDVDANQLISKYIEECYRILKDDSAIYLFCSWHKVDFFKQEVEKHFKLKNIIVWNKNNHGSGDLKGSYAPKHEFILFAHKGRAILKNKRIPDVIDVAKIPGQLLTHPTEKPVELLEKFVLNNSDKDDIIFDGFAGTGSTAIASVKNKRNFIGCELSDDYCEIANKKILEELSY